MGTLLVGYTQETRGGRTGDKMGIENTQSINPHEEKPMDETPNRSSITKQQQRENNMNQREFVKNAILSAITMGLVGQAMVDQSIETVFNGLVDGTCPYGKITPDMTLEAKVKEAKAYASPVVKNYIKKDKDLNGGVKYTPTNPRGPRKSKELIELSNLLESLIGLPQTEETAKMIKDTESFINTLEKKTTKEKSVLSLDEIASVLSKYRPATPEAVTEEASEATNEEQAG
jgi:hypothetical protein